MLKIIENSSEILNKAIKNLPTSYINNLKNKQNFEESIIARYIIYKENNILIEVDTDWKPIFNKDIFFSISHKKWLVFVWINDKKIWIDIEIFKERWEEVLKTHKKSEYALFWKENLKNFYYLWVLKESIVKLKLLWIDDFNYILIEKLTSWSFEIDWLEFNFKINWKIKWENFLAYLWEKNNIFYSISYEK